MDKEEEIAAFGETEVWITCDVCGRVYGRPDINKTMARVGEANICVDCLNKWGTSAEGVGPSRPETCIAFANPS